LARSRLLELAKTSPKHVTVSKRTLQRYRRAIAQAEDTPIEQNLALIPRLRQRGNRTPKLAPELIELIEKVAKEHFNNAAGITKRTAYRIFSDACHEEGLAPCSERIFNIRLARATNQEARVGRRLADK